MTWQVKSLLSDADLTLPSDLLLKFEKLANSIANNNETELQEVLTSFQDPLSLQVFLNLFNQQKIEFVEITGIFQKTVQQTLILSPLELAIFCGNLLAVQNLLANCLQPLEFLLATKHSSAQNSLSDSPKFVLKPANKNTHNALHFAITCNQFSIFEYFLMQPYADQLIALKDNTGKTPLDLALDLKREEMVVLLLAKKTTPSSAVVNIDSRSTKVSPRLSKTLANLKSNSSKNNSTNESGNASPLADETKNILTLIIKENSITTEIEKSENALNVLNAALGTINNIKYSFTNKNNETLIHLDQLKNYIHILIALVSAAEKNALTQQEQQKIQWIAFFTQQIMQKMSELLIVDEQTSGNRDSLTVKEFTPNEKLDPVQRQQLTNKFVDAELVHYIQLMDICLSHLSKHADYPKWQKVILAISFLLLTMGLTAGVTGIVASAAGVKYYSAFKAIMTLGGLGKQTSFIAAGLGTLGIVVTTGATTYGGYKLHRYLQKRQCKILIEEANQHFKTTVHAHPTP